MFVCSSMVNGDASHRIRGSVRELGTVTIELIKATGTCQMSPHDSFALRDVSESGRSVGEKVIQRFFFFFKKEGKYFIATEGCAVFFNTFS